MKISKRIVALAAAVTIAFCFGCDIKDFIDKPDVTPDTGLPFELSDVIWLYPNISAWPQTANLSAVTFRGDSITLNYDKATAWPGYDFGDMTLNANPWVFVEKDGQWYAATWEWLRHGQITKGTAAVAWDHIKRRELNGWYPEPGTEYGFMVSGLIRGGERNVSERSNILMVTWPHAR